MSDVDPPSPPAAARAPAPPRRPPSPPGAKKARHKRWVRIAAIATVLGVVAAAGYLVVLVVRSSQPAPDPKVEDCKRLLADIAKWVNRYAERKARMPETIAELKDWEDPAPFDPYPWDRWDKPIEYRVVDADKRDFRLRSCGPDKKPDTPDDIVWPPGTAWK
jgi:hypothetical protein